MDESNHQFADVYTALLEALPPAALPEPLSFLEADWPSMRSLSADSSSLVKQLARFGKSMLYRAGILRRQPGQTKPVWGFRLNGAGEVCLGLHDEDGRC